MYPNFHGGKNTSSFGFSRSSALLRRPFFIESFKKQYPTIIDLFEKDVRDVAMTYRSGKASPPRLQGLPETTSKFVWCNGLTQRLKILKRTLKDTIPEIFEDPAMKEAMKERKELLEIIRGTTVEKIDHWRSTISDDDKDKLKRHLMVRDSKTRLLSLNFDTDLLSLLQEVKYLERNLSDKIPAVAVEIYKNHQVYAEYIHMLQVLIERYNHPLSTIVDVERPMFQKHIDHVDEVLEDGISVLTWESEDVGEFLKVAVQEVTKFSELYNKSTSNIQIIRNKIESWKPPALFGRTDVKKSLDQNEVNNTLNNRIAIITTQSAEIGELVNASVTALTDDENSDETRQYLDYVMSIVVEGFKKNIMFSYEALLNELSPKPVSEARSHIAVPLITTRL